MQFNSALVEGKWLNDVLISVDDQGIISNISSVADVDTAGQTNALAGLVAVPGMVNVHSHAFQRAFAGLSEYRTGDRDSFWTWRKLMYDFLLDLSPDDVYVIARQLYLEMLGAGYTWVGEFHYLHNAPNGARYDNLAEMTDVICAAASDVGIGLCQIPVLYQRGGFRGQELTPGQKRFELSNDEFATLFESCRQKEQENYTCGISLHSLRAVSNEKGKSLLDDLDFSGPIHIHVAEQTKEVDDCLAAHNKRPVEFLFDHFPVDDRWCLIHATHLASNEVDLIAKSKAVVGLCPTTEANLGDGFFRSAEFLGAGGRIAIGGDSHVGVNVSEELRMIEYTQRLQVRERAVLVSGEQSVGRRLYEDCSRFGAQAIGINAGQIRVGARADLTLLDPNHAVIAGAKGDRVLDRFVFCTAGDPIAGVVIGGNVQLMDNEHNQKVRDSSVAFANVCRSLMD